MSPGSRYWPGRVRAAFGDVLGDAATVDEGFGPITVDVPVDRWTEAVELARDGLDCGFFDWLSAVDERHPEPVEGLPDGYRVLIHLAAHRRGSVDHLLLRTLVPREAASAPTVGHLYAGARWHERETHEMFGIDFTDHGTPLELEGLLLPEGFEGHPLRKDFVLASRVAKPFPGAKEPGESGDVAHQPTSARRRTRPAGVPTPDEWGPRPAGSDAPGSGPDPAPDPGDAADEPGSGERGSDA